MQNFDFGKITIAQFDAVWHAVNHITSVAMANYPYTTDGMRDMYSKLTFSDLSELSPSARREVAEVYDLLLCENRMADHSRILRQAAIDWLAYNDPNGEYKDDDALSEGWNPITLSDALRMVRNELAED